MTVKGFAPAATDGARRLANALSRYRDSNPLVLAIPRGAVPMARVIADELGGELDVVLVRKLRAPSRRVCAVPVALPDGLAEDDAVIELPAKRVTASPRG